MEQIASREVYRNPWMSVREDAVRRADGSTGIYGVVDKPDFALVLPRTERGFWLVQQYRYPIGRRAWEFPQGGWGAGAGGDSEALARAELAEETGFTAGQVVWLGHLFAAYGFCSQGFDVFLATGLAEGTPDRESTENDMVHREFSDSELDAMILDGRLDDGPSLAALALYRLRLAHSVDGTQPGAVAGGRGSEAD